MPSDGPTAFISYSREDSEFVLRMAQDLKAAGASVWMDQLDIQPGQRWARALQDAIANAPRFLVILSPHSVSSTNVEDEVAFALEERKMIIPVLFCDCKVPFQLRPFQYADFRTDYDRGLKILLHTLGVDPLVGSAAAAVIVTPEEPRPRTPSEPELARAAEQADLEEKKSEAAEQARRDEAAKLATEAARLEAARIEAERVQREEKQRLAEQTRHEEEAKQAAAQARREEEARKAVEQARREEDARQASEQARLEELEQSAARAQQKEKERLAAEQARQEEARLATERAAVEKKRRGAVEQARRDEEARQAAEQTRREEKLAAERAAAKKKLQDVADQAQREAEAKQAAEQARLEEKKLAAQRAAAEKKRKDAAELARREKEAKQAAVQREVDVAALAAKRAGEEAAKRFLQESKPASGWREDLGMKIAAGAVMLVVAVGAVWLSSWVDNKSKALLHPAAKPHVQTKPITPTVDSSANPTPAEGVASSSVTSTPPATVPNGAVTKKPLLPNGETGREALLGQHRLSLQWISWEKFGTATVVNNDGVLILKGSQHVGDEYLTVEGTVTSVFPKKFTMHGVIVTKIDSINKGQPCKRSGDMTFAITGNRQYWRLQQMDNPCEAVTDYVDIYLR